MGTSRPTRNCAGTGNRLITQTDKRGRPRTVLMAHEAATFRELQERLRCKKIWVVGAAAIATATGAHGEGGSKMRGAGMAAALTASDAELFGSPASMTEAPAAFRAMFAQGLEGYTDDRLADGAGWITFDVASIGARSPSCTAEATG
ncbi:MAG TPA: hypothetical protein VGD83_35130 [Streptosporangiaceae bacterium]